MEESDDDLSFASASDTDHETESFVDCPTISTPNSVEVLRTSSPASSLASRSSFRRRKAPKRPAPQPPGRKSPQKVVDSSEVSPSSTNAPSRPPTNHSENVKVMTSFLQEFHKNSVMEEPSGSSCVSPLQIEKPLTEFVSHPIHLVSQNEETPTNLSSPSAENVIQEISEREPSPSAFRRDLSHLQLRLIDDVAEPLSQSFPLSSTAPHSSPLHSTYLPKGSVSPYSSLPSLCSDQPLPYHQPLNAASPMPSALPSQSPVPSHPYLSQGNMASYPAPLSTIYSDLPATSQPLPDAASTPFYLASVNPNQMVPLPSQPSLPSGAPHPYVNVTPLTYVTQFPSFSGSPSFVSAPTSAGLPGSPLPKGMRVVRNPLPLSHSASDPGVNRILRGGYLVPPTGTGSLLDRLSETEERDHSDEDNDEVFLRQQSNGSSNRDLVSVGAARKVTRRSRSERYDSVGVPQLYEDFVLSSRFRLKVTFTNLTMVVIGVALLMPNSAAILYNFFRLVFGTLFPAYYSYKAVRTKNVKEYVKWMMYWIVFAFFTCAETITDVFLSFWFPFYYEIKILVVLWLLSPATRGSSILYRKFVHPWLTRKEEEIDECIAKAKQQGYSTVVQLGTKGVNYATSVIMQTAIKGGGGLVSQLKRSYSASEIGEDTADHNRNVKALPAKENIRSPSEDDDTMSVSSGSYESEPRHRAESESSSNRLRGHSTGRSIRAGKTRSADVSETYFHETAEVMPQRRSPRTHDAGRYMQPFLEPLQKEPLLRKSKHKYFSRPKSMTIGGTSASREAWLEARRNYSSGSIYSNIPESPLESSNPSSFTPPRVSLSRNASRSFRSSLR